MVEKPSKSLPYFAVATAVLTWLLILVGGIVHGTGSSLACPDWPTCYGSFFPEMKGGIFFEHSHRLVAATVGLLTIVLCILLLRQKDRGLRKAGFLAVALVIFQGLLGGLTVIYRLPTAVSTAHLATSMLFLLLLVYIAYRAFGPRLPEAALGKAKPWVLGTLALVYFQIVLGGLVRHTGAGLACLDIPLCQGSLWPAGAPPILQVHMLHRLSGIVVGLAVFAAAWRVARLDPKLRLLAGLAPLLVLVQIGLGLWSVHSALGLFPVTAHLGVGALLLVVIFLIYLNAARARAWEGAGAAASASAALRASPAA
ncbi:MAG TPA: COX15/CtaA family protein [bacterium]|nr:COX15/CtaA family protein [bacterium]